MESNVQKGDLVVAAMQGTLASWVFQPADVVVKEFPVFKQKDSKA